VDAPRFELEWTSYSKNDYEGLDGSQKLVVDKALARIRAHGMQAGQPLGKGLVGCNKIKHQKMGLRIVFRESPNGIEIIQIVAIGKRADSKVYRAARHRL
jgi:mRNA interferase RelE/StbE